MERCLPALVLFISLIPRQATAAPMVRVLEVVDGRTIVIDEAGRRSTIALAGVDFTDEEAAAAAAHLGRLVLGQWVLVERGGFVYRSPDALNINSEMARHPWRGVPGFVYLGLADPRPGANRPHGTPQSSAAAPKKSQASHAHKARKRPRNLPNLPQVERGAVQPQPDAQ